MRAAALAPVVALGLACAPPARAADVGLSTPGTNGWRPLEFPKISRHTTYTVVNRDGVDAVQAHADCSASALYVPISTVDLERTPRLQWRWRIEAGLRPTNERVKAGDDFAVRVYVMFQFDAEHASLWERARHALSTKLYGDSVPGNLISYVWSTREPAGATWDNPFNSAAKMVSLGTGPLARWRTETVDVATDYRRLFGHEPPPLLAVAVMTDTDNTCQKATAYYADFKFLTP